MKKSIKCYLFVLLNFELGVSFGMVFTEIDRINPSKNGFNNPYMITEN